MSSVTQEKTYSSSSNNSFGVVPIVSPTLSLFHDDPYMKVMHAYYAKESPIPPPTIVPPSTMLSPIWEKKVYKIKSGNGHEANEEILNHLDELSLDRIEHIEYKIEGLGKGRVCQTSEAEAAPSYDFLGCHQEISLMAVLPQL
ncbi:hypothetical protein Tco_0039995 [Tanacetum coccineum]